MTVYLFSQTIPKIDDSRKIDHTAMTHKKITEPTTSSKKWDNELF
jgi:hypothetical protein